MTTDPSEHRDGMQIEWDVPIRMDDGLVLRADVFRPPTPDPAPAILSYGPYGKGLAFQDGYPDQWEIMAREHPDAVADSSNLYQSWEVADPEKWVPQGYACVRIDSRGAGRSPGVVDPHSPREATDFAACIEWAAAQPWCTGKIGLAGISYFASNQWLVAGKHPPHLAAICPWEGAADWYRDVHYHGGIRCTFADHWMNKQVLSVQHGFGDRGARSRATDELVAGPETLSEPELEACRVIPADGARAHPLDDGFYRAYSADWSAVTVPLLSAGNWGGQALHLRGNVAGFQEAASEQKWLEIHGGAHWTSFYTDQGIALQRRFFDHFLKGDDNGWDREPLVRLHIRTIEDFVLRHENEWPIARTVWTRFHLDAAERTLAPHTATPDHATVTYVAAADGVTFRTPPLAAETEITGPVSARLFISSATTDADLFLVLQAYDPNGTEITFQGALEPRAPIAQGWLRASHRRLDPARSRPERPVHPHDVVEPLIPNQVYELEIEIWPTCIVLPAGYSLVLTVQGRDFAREDEGSELETFANVMRGSGPFLHADPADRPADTFAGAVSIHTGGDTPSSILLPIVPPLP